MTLLPVVARELRVAARRRYTYWTRFLAGAGGVLLCAWLWFGLAEQPEQTRGRTLLGFMTGCGLTYCLVAGVGVTSDCLSSEKRDGTLGLLFLTDLKGYDVVFGKLAATSLHALYRLFAIFPLLTLPLLLGGLTFSEVARIAAVLANTLFFSVSAGMLASVLSVRERRAMTATLLIILIVTTAPPIVGWLVRGKSGVFNEHWLLTSCIFPAVRAMDAGYRLNPREFWLSLASTHVLAWVFIVVSSILVPQVWQDRPAVGHRAQWQRQWRSWQFGHGIGRAVRRRRLLEVNPMLWLGNRDQLKRLAVYGMLGSFGCAWILLYLKFGSSWLDPTLVFLGAYLVQGILKIWLTADACRALAEERRTGALELVLSTPLTVDELLAGQMLALEGRFGGPVRLMLAADLGLFILGIWDSSYPELQEWLLLWGGSVILLLVDLYALAWAGLWAGLTAQSGLRALGSVLSRILILPWALFLVILVPLGTSRYPVSEPNGTTLSAAGFVLSVITSAVFLKTARTKLHERFRVVAGERYAAKARASLKSAKSGSEPREVPPLLPAH